MRRAWFLLAILLLSAAPSALAQARARVAAQIIPNPAGIPDVRVHVSDLLDDPQWLEPLRNAYRIHLHWKVQLWQKHLFADAAQPPREWDAEIQFTPIVGGYRFTERVPGRTATDTSFTTFDSLKTYVGIDIALATRRGLPPGTWYYTVDVNISALAQDQTNGPDGSGGGDGGFWQRLILGGKRERDLPRAKTVDFTIPGG